MALVDFTTLQAMGYDYLGKPFIEGAIKDTVTLQNMSYDHLGVPFVSNPARTTATNTSNFFFMWY